MQDFFPATVAPENWCLQDQFPFGAHPMFRCYASFRECIVSCFLHICRFVKSFWTAWITNSRSMALGVEDEWLSYTTSKFGLVGPRWFGETFFKPKLSLYFWKGTLRRVGSLVVHHHMCIFHDNVCLNVSHEKKKLLLSVILVVWRGSL